MNLQLQRTIYKRINSNFDIKENMELQVQNAFSLNVIYTENNHVCVATLINETSSPDHPEAFNISLEIVGIFSCEGIVTDADKQEAHVQIYRNLFPYSQSMIADLSAKAGLPSLMIEMAQLSPSEVNIGQ